LRELHGHLTSLRDFRLGLINGYSLDIIALVALRLFEAASCQYQVARQALRLDLGIQRPSAKPLVLHL
jgi:hypothetical protein